MSTYYLHDGRNEIGPFPLDILKKQPLTRNTPIRQADSDNWIAAEKLDGLKETVAPRKVRRPKDVVPVVIEKVTTFRQQRPKTAYTVMLGIALLAGISIYSISKGVNKNAPKPVASVQPVIQSNSSAVGLTEKDKPVKEAPKEDKEKVVRQHWSRLFAVTNSNYGIGFLGGIKDLKVVVTNRSDYPIDEAVAKVTYIKGGGSIWKTKLVTIYGIPAHDSKEQAVPDVGRGKKVAVSLQKLVSKKLKFSYALGKKIANVDDPYLMQ